MRRRRRFSIKRFLVFIIIICAAVYAVVNFPSTQKKVLYPFPYRAEIERYSRNYQVDRFLAVSVMKVESNFHDDARSGSGAVGLMQLMPETAAWIAFCLNENPPSISEMHECEKNIKYGIWYLAELEDEFFGNDILALAAYNAGRGNVQHWIKENGWDENFSDIDAIPYDETRNYVKRVLQCREKYSELYGSAIGYKLIQLSELRFASLKFLY
ncbi:MAG: lytic transglycosylase domain-containing protein [Selenomonadaceae bacterium]|nr:lytic transglycosylase domain-containing protein [Selenomonadaceae bacterium]